ncbi:hypothetical protein BH23GEM7_BH23GEM7_05080 [soil metagenome]|jgi:ElaB/YqjD/DUF883 family membrane-anchored ribosome-binding protein|nr:hypothetical protein [Gemmatimonadota bacterium]
MSELSSGTVLRLGIDGRELEAGARTAARSLEDIRQKARELDDALTGTEEALQQTGQAAKKSAGELRSGVRSLEEIRAPERDHYAPTLHAPVTAAAPITITIREDNRVESGAIVVHATEGMSPEAIAEAVQRKLTRPGRDLDALAEKLRKAMERQNDRRTGDTSNWSG